jgi:hypothetical protein
LAKIFKNYNIGPRIEPYPDSSLNVEWFRNDKPLPFGNRWRTSYDFGFAALDIIGSYAEDSGRYTLRNLFDESPSRPKLFRKKNSLNFGQTSIKNNRRKFVDINLGFHCILNQYKIITMLIIN